MQFFRGRFYRVEANAKRVPPSVLPRKAIVPVAEGYGKRDFKIRELFHSALEPDHRGFAVPAAPETVQPKLGAHPVVLGTSCVPKLNMKEVSPPRMAAGNELQDACPDQADAVLVGERCRDILCADRTDRLKSPLRIDRGRAGYDPKQGAVFRLAIVWSRAKRQQC
jgi:hypothetical protein